MQSANPAYAAAQAEKAADPHHDDKRLPPEVAAAARAARLEEWWKAISGMSGGTLSVGSRAPVAGYPAWATPKVLQGGFTSGEMVAALPTTATKQQQHELTNEFYLTPKGLMKLAELHESGCYRLGCPEHAALLSIAYLIRTRRIDDAQAILAEISPYFDRLQFFPLFEGVSSPIEPAAAVSIATVNDVKAQLQSILSISTNINVPRIRQLVALHRACVAWIPIKHQLLSLFSQTCPPCGHLPQYETDSAGKIIVDKRKPVFVKHNLDGGECPASGESCGWPLQYFPSGWADAAAALLTRIEFEREEDFKITKHRSTLLSSAIEDASTPIGLMIHCLRACVACGSSLPTATQSNYRIRNLTGRRIGALRAVLAGWKTTRGLPGDDKFARYLSHLQPLLEHVKQCGNVAADFVPPLITRLDACDGDRGLLFVDALVSYPVAIQHRGGGGAVVERSIPPRFTSIVKRAQMGSLAQLIAQGLVSSAEMVAALVPPLVAERVSSDIPDHSLRRLIYALRLAFAERRSLLLLNLESQVRLTELPWARCFLSDQGSLCGSAAAAARATLIDVVTQVITHFPQTILPNKLLQSLRDLVRQADLQIPLVDELAADIFMGAFTPKFVDSARRTAGRMQGTPYSTYYNLDAAFTQLVSANFAGADAFAKLCYDRAGVPSNRYGGSPAENGKVIEQEQILTSHNLVPLVDALDISLDYVTLSQRTWVWIVHQFINVPFDWHSRLKLRKDTAYAWRQLIVYFSLATQFERNTILARLFALDKIIDSDGSGGAAEKITNSKMAAMEAAHQHACNLMLQPLAEITRSSAGGGQQFDGQPVLGWCTDHSNAFFPHSE